MDGGIAYLPRPVKNLCICPQRNKRKEKERKGKEM